MKSFGLSRGYVVAVGSRTKSQLARADQARLTRRTIVAAASTLFQRDGFLTTTMAAIAAEAGVAVQTLYLSFGNKMAILAAAFAVAVAGDDEPLPMLDRGWMSNVRSEKDGPAALLLFVNGASAVVQRTTPLYMTIRSAAADPEVAAFLAENKTERHANFSVIVQALSTRVGFTKALSPARAADVLYTVVSEDTYAMFVSEHGWTAQQWQDWALRTVRAELFPVATKGRTPS